MHVSLEEVDPNLEVISPVKVESADLKECISMLESPADHSPQDIKGITPLLPQNVRLFRGKDFNPPKHTRARTHNWNAAEYMLSFLPSKKKKKKS